MAVTTTTIAGTDSLSGSRITINDNFKTLEDALNSVLSAFDIVSGRFDNSLYGSANDIITNGVTINGTGLTDALILNSGDITLLSGSIHIPAGANQGFFIGQDLKLEEYELVETVGPAGFYPTWDFRDPTYTQDIVGGLVLPSLSGAGFTAIDTAGPTPANGTLVFTDYAAGVTSPLKLWWANGPAGATWYQVPMTLI